ncbi:MAG: ABC transporter permease [Acidobacteriota bacterium]
METLLQDMRYSIRMLAKRPTFTLVATLTLAIGIGANTAIFSLVNAVLIRKLPFENSQKLVWIWSTRVDRDKAFFSIPDFIDYRDRSETLEQIAAFANWGASLTGTDEPERMQGVRISANAFQMLGVSATLGRTLLPEDDRPDSERVVVLSYGLWERRFGHDPGIIGHKLTLNSDSYTVLRSAEDDCRARVETGLDRDSVWARGLFCLNPGHLGAALRSERDRPENICERFGDTGRRGSGSLLCACSPGDEGRSDGGTEVRIGLWFLVSGWIFYPRKSVESVSSVVYAALGNATN